MTHVGIHDQTLVALSVLVAVFASYTALDLAGRARAAGPGTGRWAWLAAAAVAMGGGIWAMHFIGMLAFSVPSMATHYDLGLTLASLALPIVAAGLGFWFLLRTGPSLGRTIVAGIALAVAIVTSYGVGIAAMRLPADVTHDAAWLAASIALAVVAATAALWLAFDARQTHRIAAAAMMGLAIAGMHYLGIEATTFTPHVAPHPFALIGVEKARLGYAVAIITFFILFLALIAALYDRRFALLAEQESAALRESEARFRLLYRNTPLPLHSLDFDGMIEQVSETWLKLLGYERHEVVGRPLAAFMRRDSAQRWVTVDSVELAAGTPLHDAEYQFEHRSGRALDVLMSASVEKGTSGRIVRILCGLVDVTARKQAEAALRQAHKMETVGQLTGGIAHDFNNLLTVVIGNLEGAQRAAQTGLFVKAQRNIDAALHGAMRAAGVTERLLAFSRPQPVQPRIIDINELVGGMSDLFRRTLGRSVSVKTELGADLWRVRVDANQLENALLNLAINSRDAMPNGGPITIRTANLKAEDGSPGAGITPGDYAVVAVEDRGTGIPAEIAEKIFEPFFTTKGEGQGTGLGLAMVQSFARQAGGDVRIDSTVGEGTTVTIYLPRAAEAAAALATAAAELAAVARR